MADASPFDRKHMAVDVTTQTVIPCPVEIVSAHAPDPDNVPEWYVSIKPARPAW